MYLFPQVIFCSIFFLCALVLLNISLLFYKAIVKHYLHTKCCSIVQSCKTDGNTFIIQAISNKQRRCKMTLGYFCNETYSVTFCGRNENSVTTQAPKCGCSWEMLWTWEVEMSKGVLCSLWGMQAKRTHLLCPGFWLVKWANCFICPPTLVTLPTRSPKKQSH